MAKTNAELLVDAGHLLEQEDASQRVANLLKDNHKYRGDASVNKSDAQTLADRHQEELTTLRSQLLSDDMVAVPKDDYELLGKLKEVHTDDNDIFVLASEVPQLRASLQQLKDKAVIGQAAAKGGWNSDVLTTLLQTVEGSIVEKDSVFSFIDNEKKEHTLDDFVNSQFEAFIPSLQTGRKYPKQQLGSGGSSTDENIVDTFLAKKKADNSQEKK